MILPIPQQAEHIGFIIFKLIQLSQIVKDADNDEDVIIDFCNTKFLHCTFLAGLFGLIRGWRKEGRNVIIDASRGNLCSYLQAIYFDKGFASSIAGFHDKIKLYHAKTYLPMILFDVQGKEREACASAVFQVIKEQTGLKNEYINAVDYLISELTNNIAEHSEDTNGLVTFQYYPTKGFIDICIADNGIGLYKSYEKSAIFHPANEEEAIKYAVRGRSTKDRAESRGFGISTSIDMITTGLNGTFILWSGENYYIKNRKIEKIVFEENASFIGCYVTLRLHLNVENFKFYDYVNS